MEENFIITKLTKVIFVGVEEYYDRPSHFNFTLKNNELVYYFSGHAEIFFNDQTVNVRDDHVFLLPMGTPTRYDVTRHKPGACIVVYFQADVPVSNDVFCADFAHNPNLRTLFKRLFSTWVGKNEGYYFSSVSLLYKIFSEMQSSSLVPKQHFEKIRPAVDHIHERFLLEDLKISDLAATCGMKESYFQRLFKEKYGVSPIKYIIQLKINHACELLELEQYSITQIADICNFSDVYFFSRQFKQYTGITPTQYIQKHKSSKK